MKKYYDRELSWLSFNYRVLQEAKDSSVPLYERIKFLAIFSSNLDEYFRVRVASLRSLLTLKEKTQKKLKFDPERLLSKINKKVVEYQEEYGKIFMEEIIPELKQNDILLINEQNVSAGNITWLKDYFNESVLPYINPMLLQKKKIVPFLKNKSLYLGIVLEPIEGKNGSKKKIKYALVEIPEMIKRFIVLPQSDKYFQIMFIDDVIRLNLSSVFPGYKVLSIYSVKLTRDAELYIDDEFSGDLLDKIKKGLSKRKLGVPCRFLYDKNMPQEFLEYLKETFGLSKNDLVPGGKYHNLNDLFGFPAPQNKPELFDNRINPLCIKPFENVKSLFSVIDEQDVLISVPYQDYSYVIRILNEAADDPLVENIKITLYRVSSGSKIIRALIKAALNKKKVTAFVEIKARFDEESNLNWASELERSGVEVLYSFPGLKVHSKLCLISRYSEGSLKKYAYLATGNFNEKTAQIYADHGLFTSHSGITTEAEQVFDFLSHKKTEHNFRHLLVAQFNLRDDIYKLIDNEIDNALNGSGGSMILKMNSLEDKKMIKKLYIASMAGIKIKLIVRGICCLIPGQPGLSENIEVISIVDRYLEHARVFIFNNNGNPLYYLGSADLMSRNLNRRIEVVFPIYDKSIQDQLQSIIDIQLNDNSKARIIDRKQLNNYKYTEHEPVRSQDKIYSYLQEYQPVELKDASLLPGVPER